MLGLAYPFSGRFALQSSVYFYLVSWFSVSKIRKTEGGDGIPLPGLLVTVKAINKFNHLYLIVICDGGVS